MGRGGGGAEVQLALKADNFTAICEPIAYKMLDPRHRTTPWTSMACKQG
jgi:hypothetical protein